MPLLKLCSDDPLVKTLQAVFKANIIRIPETRFKPLTVIAMDNGKPHFWGYMDELLEGNLLDAQSLLQESKMADVSGKRSKSVNVEIGLQILEGFLSGFGLPAAGIATKFAGAKTVSFSFQEVMRQFISPAGLGKLLKGRVLDPAHSANAIFFRDEARLYVVDSVITSQDFSINVATASAHDFSLDIPAIEKMVGQVKAGVQVTSSSNLDITFKGTTPLAFAFSCLHCDLDGAGRISLKPAAGTAHFGLHQTLAPELLFDEPAMIEWE